MFNRLTHIVRRLGLHCCVAVVVSGCASREFVVSSTLVQVRRSDPDYTKLRVYPSQDFVVVYSRDLGQATGVSGTEGTVETGHRAQQIEVPIKRSLPGAIIDSSEIERRTVLWVSFDTQCRDRACAFGFVQSTDGRFRMFQVPAIEGYGAPRIYRKRVAPRSRMERTNIYSNSEQTSVYFTMRGVGTSVALELKKRGSEELDIVVVTPGGVPPGGR